MPEVNLDTANMPTRKSNVQLSMELLERVYREAPIGLCLLDTDLRFIFINEWLAALNGRTIDEHLGRTLAEVIPDVAPGAESQLRYVLKTGKPIEGGIVEIDNPERPDEKIVFQHNYHAVREGDSIVGVSCAVQDITQQLLANRLQREIDERTSIEQDLRNSEKQFRSLLEAAPDAMIFSEQGGSITIVNTQVEELFGYSRKELLGQSIELLIPSRLQKSHAAHRHKYCENPLTRTMGAGMELFGRCKDGSEVPVEITLSLIDTPNGPLVASIIRDITQRKENEVHLLQARRETSIQQERLARLVRIQTLGEMASGIAHEINQPLAAIQSYAMATQRYLPPHKSQLKKVKELLAKISTQALRAGGIVSHLRALMQHRDVVFKSIDINAAIKEVTKLAEIDTVNHDCRLILNFSPSLPMVNCDEIQIQQVVINLVRNAIEAMENLTQQVNKVVTIETALGETGMVEVSISDCGPGIGKEVENMIFDAFFTTKNSGMGMGLAICNTIVNAHGGKIGFTDIKPTGVMFSFSLPAEK